MASPPDLQQGALYVQFGQPGDLTLGIGFGKTVSAKLAEFPAGRSAYWSGPTLNAFAVASENKAPRNLELAHYQSFGREPGGEGIGPG